MKDLISGCLIGLLFGAYITLMTVNYKNQERNITADSICFPQVRATYISENQAACIGDNGIFIKSKK